MNYEEILKCYEGETDIHASTSFEFGLMNDLYYQLFYSYPAVDYWERSVTVAETLMKGTGKRLSIPKTGNIVYRTTNLICTTIGIPRWRRSTIGEMQYRTQIAYVKSVLTF